MRSVLLPGVLLFAAIASAPAHAARDEPRCQEGHWTVDGSGLFPDDGNSTPDVLLFDGRYVSIPGRCAPVVGRMKRRCRGDRNLRAGVEGDRRGRVEAASGVRVIRGWS